MKLKILILLCACIVARAQTPAPNPPAATTNQPDAPAGREALRRSLRSLNTNAPAAPAAPSTTPARTFPAPPPAPGAATTAPPAPVPAQTNQPVALPSGQTNVTRSTSADITDPDQIIPAGTINFPAVDINQVLPIYAELVNRTILRPAALPAAPITLKTQTPLTKREAIDALNAVLAMNGIAMVNIGEKFVKAVPSAQVGTTGGKFNRDDPSTFGDLGGYVTHVMQLKFAKPSELAPILTPLASPSVGGVAVQAIDSSQILVLRDTTENVKRMLELIKEIDIVPTSEFVSEVIPIKYALATDIADALNGLSSGGGGTTIGRSSSTGVRSTTPGTTTPGFNPGGVSSPGTLSPTRSFGSTTGTTTQPGGATTPSFSERLQGILRSASRATGSGDFQILGQTKIIADSRTNSLLIFANKQDMDMIKDIISKLDVVLAQVLIEAIIMEVSLDDQRTIGFSYLQRPQTSGKFTGVGAILNANRFPDAANFVPGTGSGTNASAGLASGFSYLARFNQDLDVAVAAIATDGRVNVLSRPRIQTSHAVPASIEVGTTVPYITGTTFGDFAGVSSRSVYQERFVGIKLDVLPLINADGLVVMDIQQAIEQLGAPTTIDGNAVPTTTRRNASAKVAVRDRDTIILGGFISNSKTKSKSGVPYLKDIPLLGYLFRSTTDQNQRVELIVMMRPTVLPTPESAAVAAAVERDKLPGVRRAQIEYEKDEAARLKKFQKSERKEAADQGYYEFEPFKPVEARPGLREEYQFEPVEGIKE